MNKFFKIFKAVFPHFVLVMSLVLTVQWIFTLFNPNLGLINMNNTVSCVELIVYFVVCFAGALLWIIDLYRKKK